MYLIKFEKRYFISGEYEFDVDEDDDYGLTTDDLLSTGVDTEDL